MCIRDSNKIDTLSGMGPLKVCTAYRKADGTVIRDFPPTIDELAECLPVYEELEGFDGDLSGCRSFDELPASCKRYIAELERLCECQMCIRDSTGRTYFRASARFSSPSGSTRKPICASGYSSSL